VQTLDALAKVTRHLLIDFDGPVCSVFAGVPAPEVAQQLRASLITAGFDLGADAQDEDDPIEVFRQAARLGPQAAMTAQQLLTVYETRAIPTARPAPGSADLIITARQTGRTVTIVSNNSGAAIAAYLADHDLTGYVGAIVARDDSDPERMKPSPYRVREAVRLLNAASAECTLIGDSTSDVTAGHLAGVAVIGYANKAGKAEALAAVQAAATTDRLDRITTALCSHPLL
jgi:beta-phosphoglucomutase-like phosphatase (HAD superfamily)